jgi:hypothetical protein
LLSIPSLLTPTPFPKDPEDAFYYVNRFIDRVNEENQFLYGEHGYDKEVPEITKEFTT